MEKLRRRTSCNLRVVTLAVLMAMAALLLASCVTAVSHNCRRGLKVMDVRYEVTSTAGIADIEVLGAGGESVRYRRERTPWRLTESVQGYKYVLLRASSSRPLGTVSVSIYVDDMLWKKKTFLGSGIVEADGLIETKRGWDCGYRVFLQTWTEESEKYEEPVGDK